MSEASQAATGARPVYRERLHAPLRWWVQLTMFLATLWLACIVSMPAWLAWTATAVICLLAYGLMAWTGMVQVSVRGGELVAGRAHIPLRLLGEPEVLDREGTRHSLGVGADARAWLVVRPYLKRSVRVPVHDADDPTPYWLVSSRRPDALAAAIGAGRPASD